MYAFGEDNLTQFDEVRVELRSASGTRQHAWIVEVDKDSDQGQLLIDLVETLPIQGTADDYELRIEGSLNKPLFVLVAKHSRSVRGYRDAGSENG